MGLCTTSSHMAHHHTAPHHMAWQIEFALILPSGRAGKGSHVTIKRMGMDGGSKVGPRSSLLYFAPLCSLYRCSLVYYCVPFCSVSGLTCSVLSFYKDPFSLFHTHPLLFSSSSPFCSLFYLFFLMTSHLSSFIPIPSLSFTITLFLSLPQASLTLMAAT